MFCCGPLPVLRRGRRHNPGSGIGSFFLSTFSGQFLYFSLQFQYITLHSGNFKLPRKIFEKILYDRSASFLLRNMGRTKCPMFSFAFFSPPIFLHPGQTLRLLIQHEMDPADFLRKRGEIVYLNLCLWARTCGLRNSGSRAIRLRLCRECCVRRGNLRTGH